MCFEFPRGQIGRKRRWSLPRRAACRMAQIDVDDDCLLDRRQNQGGLLTTNQLNVNFCQYFGVEQGTMLDPPRIVDAIAGAQGIQ